ncbi:hypothetical protein ANN_17582 [Periplaneta americana]|uniref:Uncharacterized protein n=1 Tax=Periplaneta americana TaxID=6978 RepID=A0ABQ8STX0_PERAM|nr:hypothetical protein ANN_17582 [Periplaneta americana]
MAGLCEGGNKSSGSLKAISIRPVTHSPERSVPIPPPSGEDVIPEEHELSEFSDYPSTSADLTYIPEHHTMSHLIRQAELNDLVRDLGLSMQHADLLGSRLQEWTLLAKDNKISVFRKRNDKLTSYFAMENSACACKNVNGLMDECRKNDIEPDQEEEKELVESLTEKKLLTERCTGSNGEREKNY